MATLATVRTEVRERLNEPTARFWSNTELNRWINEGQRDIARRLEVLQMTASTNIVAGTNDYTLTQNIVRIYRVEFKDASGVIFQLEYRDFNTMDSVGYGFVDVSATGYPCFYTLWGIPPSITITLFPKPDISVTNGLTIYYYGYPNDMSADGDTISLPGGWEDLIVDYAEFSALRKNKDQRWVEAKQLYEAKLDTMRGLTRRWTDQPSVFDNANRRYPFWYFDDEWGY